MARFSAAHVYEVKGRRYRYRYVAVTSGGAGVHSKEYVDLGACRRQVERMKPMWPDAEVQRVRQFLMGDDPWSSQYELEHNGRWTPETKVRASREGSEDLK